MYISREEENKNRAISLGVSLGFMALILLLCLFVFKIITPNPPFPEGGGEDGVAFNIGNLVEGTGNVENNGIGEAPKVIEQTEVTPNTTAETSSENMMTSENGVDVNAKEEVKENTPKNTTVVIPVKPKEKTAAELLAEKFNKSKGKNGGGDGNSGEAGNEGKPDGKPDTDGNGGTGDHGPGDSDGHGGPGSGGNKSGYSFNLGGRSIVTKPPISKDTKEEGTVVVEITVDKNGNVIKADAVGRGTNTNSVMLKAKARQAALATKFNVGSNFEEQHGTITFVFSF